MWRNIFTVVLTASIVLVTAAPATAAPQFIARAEWAKWGDLSSLRVYPTAAGRAASGQPDSQPLADRAWTEVLALAPDAAMPGMREQFDCHWWLAEIGQSGKVSWNLEPWRPEVDQKEMAATNCNPGGTEEPF